MDENINIVVDSSSAKRGIDVLVDSFSRLNRTMASAETSTDKFFRGLTSGLDKAQAAFLSFRNIAMGFTTVIALFNQIGAQMSKFQAFISAMSVSVGGVKQARVEYAFLMDMSNRLGVSINSLSHNYSQLAAATNGTSITTDGLRRIFESFSIAARVMHLSTIDTRLMFYALTQMVSKGSVSMEELRRQLGEKLPGAMKIAASSVNATSDELESAIRKGIVDPAKFLPIFADAVRQTFGPGLALAMKAFDAELNRMTNSVQALIVQMYDLGVAEAFTKVIKEINRLLNDPVIGDRLAKAVKALADEATKFLSSITADDVSRFLTTFSNGLVTLGQTIGNILPKMKQLADYMGPIVSAYVVLKGIGMGAVAGQAIAPGPIGGVVGGVVGAGVAAGGIIATRNAFNSVGTDMAGSTTRPIRGAAEAAARQAAQNQNLNAEYFGGNKSSFKLSDVLKASDKNKTSPMDTFIQLLRERDVGTGSEGNKYEAMRARAQALAVKNPGRLKEALSIIDELEARGDEFDPLIRSIAGLIDRENKMTPDAIDRQIQAMITKYPGATGKGAEAKQLGAQFRKQFDDKMQREQDDFNSKQTEIIRRLEVEKNLYTEQFQLIGKGADEKERILKKLEMEKRLEEQIADLRKEALLERRAFDENGFRGQGRESIDKAIAELRRLQDAKKTADAGWKQSIQDYVDSVADMATQVSGLMGKAFKGMEDAIVTFVKTGKLSFRSLADSIIEDLIRIQVRKAIVGPLAQMLGGFNLFGGAGGAAAGAGTAVTSAGSFMLAHGGGIVGSLNSMKMVSNDAFAGARRFHGGGLVGGEEPIVAMRGEGVFTPEQMKNLAPVGKSGGGNNVNIKVDVNMETGATNVTSDEGQLKQLGARIGQKVREEIAIQMRPGGMLAN